MSRNQENKLPFSFSGWKILLPIALGVIISSYLLYNAVNSTAFVQVDAGNGTHAWVDINKNKVVDYKIAEEFVLQKNGDFSKESFQSFLSTLEGSSQIYFGLLLAVLFMIGRDLFYMIRIRVLTKNQLGWKQSFYVIMIWEFASALSPGIVGGAAVAMFILKKEGLALGRSTALVIITAFLDNLFYLLLIPLVFITVSRADLFPSDSGFGLSSERLFYIGLFVIFCVCLLLYIGLFRLPNLIGNLLSRLFSLPFLNKWKVQAVQTGKDISLASKVLRKEPFRFWLKAFGATFGSWICRYLVINALLGAFLNISFAQHVLLLTKQLVLWLFLLISPTPGASGVAEFAFSQLLSNFSSSAILLVFLAVLWRLISYFPYLFIGSILLPRWLRSKN
ncbi:MAG: flippase-like domain-containing protein [Bacteroidetes bacterium]|nr:flippase-like domain-containing protein [Bacteroidota bacterium]